MTANLTQNLTHLENGHAEQFLEYNDSLKYIDNLEEAYSHVYVPIFVILVIISNLIVVVSSGLLFKEGFEPRCTYLLLGNISLADLTMSFVVIVGWFKIGAILPCTLHLSIYVMGSMCSSLSVGLIAIDRYIYIIHGIKYKQLIYPQRVRYMLWGTWTTAIMGGAVPLAVFGKEAPECWFTLVAPPSVILIRTAICTIPLVCVIVFYGIILHKAIKNVRNLKRAIGPSPTKAENQSEGLRMYVGKSSRINTISLNIEKSDRKTTSVNNETYMGTNMITESTGNLRKGKDKINNPNTWKAIKVVLFTAGTYTVTWLPYYITSSMYIFCDHENTPNDCKYFLINVISPLGLFTFMSALTNPIIYAWWHKRFRVGIINVYNKYARLYRLRSNNIT